MYFPAVTYAVWVLAAVSQICCAFFLWKRGWIREHLFFFLYILLQLITDAILHPLAIMQTKDRALYETYFYAFWVAEALDLILIAVIFLKIFRYSFADYGLLRKLSTVVYLAITAVCLGMAVAAATAAPAADTYPLTTALLSLNHSMQVLRMGTMVGFLALALVLAIPLGNLTVGLTLGFGLEAALSLLATTLRQFFGYGFTPWYNLITAVSYLVALLTFCAYLVAPRRELAQTRVVERDTLQRWNQALSEMLQR